MEVKYSHFLKSDQIKIELLKLLSDGNPHTPSELAISLRTNSKTIEGNCKFLELIDAIKVQEILTKRKVRYITISREGIALKQKIEKRIKEEDNESP
jgi:DNA-binding MarR family transcriptional regulator